MMGFTRCETCKEWHWNHEKCPDIYLWFKDDYTDENGSEIRADSYESAAEKAAIRVNDEYNYMNEEIEIEVEKKGTGIKRKFIVVPEPSIHYNISEVK